MPCSIPLKTGTNQKRKTMVDLALHFDICLGRFDRKWVSTAVYRHGIEAASRGTAARATDKKVLTFLFAPHDGFDDVLPLFDQLRVQCNYSHVETAKCLQYQCQNFHVLDGNWKINCSHSATPVQVSYCCVYVCRKRLKRFSRIEVTFTSTAYDAQRCNSYRLASSRPRKCQSLSLSR